MSTQPAEQRGHWEGYDSVGLPVPGPAPPLSVEPSRPVPETTGTTTLAGPMGSTLGVGEAVADALPAVFEAVTTARTLAPTSAWPSVYEEEVSPPMSAQPGEQRCHW